MAIGGSKKSTILEGGGGTDYPWYSLKFWHGMGVVTWFKLVAENRALISPARLTIVATISILSGFNSLGRLITDWVYRYEIRSVELPKDPIFIIGHWRSGTTLLHELMMLDERFTTPTTYQSFAPGHFLITEDFFQRFCGWLLPKRRPMDNVETGWARPQEDEFALMNLGAPSPYRRIAFPLCSSITPEALDLSTSDPITLNLWKHVFIAFLLRFRVKDKRRPVLKSPTHTARLSVLLDIFPQAKFIHITRNPYSIFPSTRRLWQALHQTQSLQSKLDARLDSYILNCFHEMYVAFRRDTRNMAKHQLCEIKYEDLIANPESSLQNIYDQLDLGDFSGMHLALQGSIKKMKKYKANTYSLSKKTYDLISSEWNDYMQDYGYQQQPTSVN